MIIIIMMIILLLLITVIIAITTPFEKYVKEFGIEMRVEHVQKPALLGTVRVLRLVLGPKYPGSET